MMKNPDDRLEPANEFRIGVNFFNPAAGQESANGPDVDPIRGGRLRNLEKTTCF
jgi:hypothetical protein